MGVALRNARRRSVVSALLAIAAGWAAYQLSDQIGDAVRSLLAGDALRLLGAGLCEVVAYLAIGTALRRLTRSDHVTRADAVRLGFVTSGLGSVLPAAPVEGIVLAARELEERGVSRRRTFVALGLSQWFAVRGFFALGAVAALTVAFFGRHFAILLAASAALAVMFVMSGALVTRLRLPRRWSMWLIEMRESAGSRYERGMLVVLAAVASAADALCFALALVAAGVHTSPDVLLLAYGVAMLSVFVPLLPAGIGVTEAAVPAFLHAAHVPIAAALGGVLAYRALATVLPALLGAGALGQLRLRRRFARVIG